MCVREKEREFVCVRVCAGAWVCKQCSIHTCINVRVCAYARACVCARAWVCGCVCSFPFFFPSSHKECLSRSVSDAPTCRAVLYV